MNRKATQLLVLGVSVAIVIALFVYSLAEPSASLTSSSNEGAAKAQPAPQVREIASQAEVDTGVAPDHPTGVMLVPESPRPDAGDFEHPGRTYGMAGILFFTIFVDESTRDTRSVVDSIVQITKVDENTAWKFLEYMRQSKESLDQFESKAADQMCVQRDGRGTIAQLAMAFDKVDSAVESRRAQLTRGSEAVLGPEGMRNFELYLSSKDRDKRPRASSNEERLTELRMDPTEVLAVFCSKERRR